MGLPVEEAGKIWRITGIKSFKGFCLRCVVAFGERIRYRGICGFLYALNVHVVLFTSLDSIHSSCRACLFPEWHNCQTEPIEGLYGNHEY